MKECRQYTFRYPFWNNNGVLQTDGFVYSLACERVIKSRRLLSSIRCCVKRPNTIVKVLSSLVSGIILTIRTVRRYEIPTSSRLKSVAHSEIKLKQNTESAWNSSTLVSALLAYLFTCWKYANEPQTNLTVTVLGFDCFRLFQCFISVLFQNVQRP